MRKLLIAAIAVLPLAALAATPKTVTLDVKNMTCELPYSTVHFSPHSRWVGGLVK